MFQRGVAPGVLLNRVVEEFQLQPVPIKTQNDALRAHTIMSNADKYGSAAGASRRGLLRPIVYSLH